MADTTLFNFLPFHKRRAFPFELTLATLLTLAASVCLWLAAFSTPFIKSIYYLGLSQEGESKFGTFGYCYGGDLASCSSRSAGWATALSTSIDGSQYLRDLNPNSNGLTGALIQLLILTPIAAGLATFAAICLGISWFRRQGALTGFLVTLIATGVAILSLILALAAFVVAHRGAKFRPPYDAALWLHMSATICLVVALPFSLPAWQRQRKTA